MDESYFDPDLNKDIKNIKKQIESLTISVSRIETNIEKLISITERIESMCGFIEVLNDSLIDLSIELNKDTKIDKSTDNDKSDPTLCYRVFNNMIRRNNPVPFSVYSLLNKTKQDQ